MQNTQSMLRFYLKILFFDHKTFLEGPKKAFEIIITAFNKGDKGTLKGLVSKDVFNAFENTFTGPSIPRRRSI